MSAIRRTEIQTEGILSHGADQNSYLEDSSNDLVWEDYEDHCLLGCYAGKNDVLS
jgi:hypothetical protein